MENLIKALNILKKYPHDEHDSIYFYNSEMRVYIDCNVNDILKEDIFELEFLGFFWMEDEDIGAFQYLQ